MPTRAQYFNNATMAELQEALKAKQGKAQQLLKTKATLERQLAGINRLLQSIQGGIQPGGRVQAVGLRPKAVQSAAAGSSPGTRNLIAQVVKNSPTPMNIANIRHALVAAGYKQGRRTFTPHLTHLVRGGVLVRLSHGLYGAAGQTYTQAPATRGSGGRKRKRRRTPRAKQPGPLKQLVAQALAASQPWPMTIKQICKAVMAMGYKPARVRRFYASVSPALSELKREGKVSHMGRSLYGVANTTYAQTPASSPP